ncbi:hypothetical protein [Streptomyces vietnamensis]|uniref:Lipoprotein n=1 Tax=Streptomyces vietnamensis TaxID=362257 RepID=A0A0B5HNS8_9ACTN|nr:hypothetical protein [Streptomyces vietnamensis]AJF63765.1 hypothetical protein SVTN_04225 [Streptomyces vietnamensis]
MRVPLFLGVTTAVVVLSACGAPQARLDGATGAGRFFEESLAAGNFAVACGLLAPESREQLEEGEKKPCAKALPSQGLPRGGAVRSVDVYGRQALLRLDGDVLFLSEFDEGWRVTAAGCTPEEGDMPYHCALKGA